MSTGSPVGEQQELDRLGVGSAQMADGVGVVAKLGQDGIGVFTSQWSGPVVRVRAAHGDDWSPSAKATEACMISERGPVVFEHVRVTRDEAVDVDPVGADAADAGGS